MTTPAPTVAVSPATPSTATVVFEQDLLAALQVAQQTLPSLLQVVSQITNIVTGKATVAAGASSSSGGSSSGSGSSGSTTVNVGASETIGITTDVGAVANAVGSVATASGKIADAVAAHEKDMNTPEMQGASEDEKWQAFVNRINAADKAGDVKTEESLQG